MCVDGRSRNLYSVLGGHLHILGAPSVQSCCTLSISASYHVFVLGRYRKIQTCLCVVVGPGFVSTSPDCMRSNAGHADQSCQITVNREGGFDTIYTAVCNCCDSSTACRLCRLAPIFSHYFILHYFQRKCM